MLSSACTGPLDDLKSLRNIFDREFARRKKLKFFPDCSLGDSRSLGNDIYEAERAAPDSGTNE